MNICVVGDCNTGKTTFCRGRKDTSYVPTVGVDFALYDNGEHSFKFWDTAGQERFRAVGAHYYRLASTVCIFYACDLPSSIKSVPYWQSLVSLHSDAKQIVIGAKCDLPGPPGEYSGMYPGPADIFISTKNNEGIEELYCTLHGKCESVSLELIPTQRTKCCYF